MLSLPGCAGSITDTKSDLREQLGKLIDYFNTGAWVVHSVEKTEAILPRGANLSAIGELGLQDDPQGDYRGAGALSTGKGMVLALKACPAAAFAMARLL